MNFNIYIWFSYAQFEFQYSHSLLICLFSTRTNECINFVCNLNYNSHCIISNLSFINNLINFYVITYQISLSSILCVWEKYDERDIEIWKESITNIIYTFLCVWVIKLNIDNHINMYLYSLPVAIFTENSIVTCIWNIRSRLVMI